MTSPPNNDAALVRRMLLEADEDLVPDDDRFWDAVTALDRLAAALQAAQQELQRLRAERMTVFNLNAEHDERVVAPYVKRAERAEATVTQLLGVLREVERYFGSDVPPAGFPMGLVRAALAQDTEQEGA